MAKDLSAARLRKLLATATKEQLIEEIAVLFTKFDIVQKHFLLKLQPPDDSSVLDEYKARVTKAMLPKSTHGEPKVQVARQLISEYRKISVSESSLIDLMLVYVECGVEFLHNLGDYKESFYDSLQSMFEATLKLIQKNNLESDFVDRCQQVVVKCNNTGYGFEDEMAFLLKEYFKSQ